MKIWFYRILWKIAKLCLGSDVAIQKLDSTLEADFGDRAEEAKAIVRLWGFK